MTTRILALHRLCPRYPRVLRLRRGCNTAHPNTRKVISPEKKSGSWMRYAGVGVFMSLAGMTGMLGFWQDRWGKKQNVCRGGKEEGMGWDNEGRDAAEEA
eukprot:1356022-Amorphochlora_amoeboformis.AAC.2